MRKYDKIDSPINGFSKVELNDKWGFIDRTGKEICPVIYDEVWDFWWKFTPVRIGDKEGFINRKGEEICPVKYDKVQFFAHGFARVRIGLLW